MEMVDTFDTSVAFATNENSMLQSWSIVMHWQIQGIAKQGSSRL